MSRLTSESLPPLETVKEEDSGKSEDQDRGNQ